MNRCRRGVKCAAGKTGEAPLAVTGRQRAALRVSWEARPRVCRGLGGRAGDMCCVPVLTPLADSG
jgi:hypothetical protein